MNEIARAIFALFVCARSGKNRNCPKKKTGAVYEIRVIEIAKTNRGRIINQMERNCSSNNLHSLCALGLKKKKNVAVYEIRVIETAKIKN